MYVFRLLNLKWSSISSRLIQNIITVIEVKKTVKCLFLSNFHAPSTTLFCPSQSFFLINDQNEFYFTIKKKINMQHEIIK